MIRCLAFLCISVLGYLLGIYFYRLGFLLSRNAILINSTCLEVQAATKEACWTEPRFHKAIVVVIDALRFDFLLWHDNYGIPTCYSTFICGNNI